MNKNAVTTLLIFTLASPVVSSAASSACDGEGDWVNYAEASNGDLFFFDRSRVETTGSLRHVCHGIRYKTSVMGASSFLELLEIDCSEQTEKSLQSTFFTDGHWERAAMKTDMSEKRKKPIAAGSVAERLTDAVCN